MTLPKVYRRSSDALANYNFMDFSSKTGYLRTYAVYNNTAASGGILSNIAIDSYIWRTIFIGVTPSGTLNFDLVFKSPQVVRGIANLAFTLESVSASVATASCAITIKKVDAANVESSISSVFTSDSFVFPGGTASRRFSIPITINETSFKIEEKIRLAIKLDGAVGSAPREVRFYHDGGNRQGNISLEITTSSYPDTNIIFDIPFKIDI